MPTKVNLKVPRTLWTAQDSMRLALNTLASIKLRTSNGIDANGDQFDKYSTKPIYVAKRGARLSPKGGRPSRTGNSIYYAGGYAQYKHDSRRRGGKGKKSAEVDLVLSGQLMNNLVVLEATPTGFTIGLTKHVQSYGYHVNDKREFLGLTDDDIEILTEAVGIEVRQKLGLNK
jgi:hypothetical protein